MTSPFEFRLREALEVARQRHGAFGLMLSEYEGTSYGASPSMGIAMAHHEGQKEILTIFEQAISGDWPEPEPLPERLYG